MGENEHSARPAGQIGCLNGCAKAAFCRGLCTACYPAACKRIRAGKTTWEALMAAGQALPARPNRDFRLRLPRWLWDKRRKGKLP